MRQAALSGGRPFFIRSQLALTARKINGTSLPVISRRRMKPYWINDPLEFDSGPCPE